MTPRQTCPQPKLRAQLAFKNSMVHGILQFTPSIAFRYVLHRCESRDIRCRESFIVKTWHRSNARLTGQRESAHIEFVFLDALRAGVRCFAEKRPTGERSPAWDRDGPAHEAPSDAPTPTRLNMFTGRSAGQVSTMILPQVHLRKPCYDFSFL